MEVESAGDGIGVEPRVNGVEEKLFAVHRAGPLIGGVAGRTHPLKVPADKPIDACAHVRSLRIVAGANHSTDDRGAQFFWRNTLKRVINVRQMFAIELV